MATTTEATTQEVPSGPIYVDTQHEDLVHDAQLDYYGCKLATASSDRTVKVYNVSENSYELSATLQGHEGPVWQVSWSHPRFGVILASCSFDGSVLIHRETRPRDWTLLYAARHIHESSVNGIQFAPHEFGCMVAAASSDGKVSVLSLQPDNSWSIDYIQDSPLGVNAISWAPHGAYYDENAAAAAAAAAGTDQQQQQPQQQDQPPRLVTGGCDNQLRFWVRSNETGQWVEDTEAIVSTNEHAHSDWIRDVAWAPSIVPNVNMVASCSEDRTVLIWTQKGGKNSEWKPTLLHTFDAPVWRVSWSVTGHMLAVSSGDKDVTLWKPSLDSGGWTQMSTVEDEAAPQQQQQQQG